MVAQQLKEGKLDVAFADPLTTRSTGPRNLIVWRGNLIGTSSRATSTSLKHLLGAQNGVMREGTAGAACTQVKYLEEGPAGKLDLMVDINFRLNSTGAYPTSSCPPPPGTRRTTSTPRTCTLHPSPGEAVTRAGSPSPTGRSSVPRPGVFSGLAAKAPGHQEGSGGAAAAARLRHGAGHPLRSGQELEEGRMRPDPGKTMAAIKVVERDYGQTCCKFIALAPE